MPNNVKRPGAEHISRDTPHKDQFKTGTWSFTFPDGETITATGTAGGHWAVIRRGVRYAIIFSFDFQGKPICVVSKRINPAKPFENPSPEQVGLKAAVWVRVKTKEVS